MQLIPSGAILTQASDALIVAQQVYISTFGQNVNLVPSSPQGQAIQELALIIQESDNNVAFLLSSLNPNLATGIALDAICSNLFVFRKPAGYSEATCQVTGLSGVTIPSGSQIQSTNGDVFLAQAPITIGSNGQGSGVFIATTAGSGVPVTANTLTAILTGVSGWDTVNNPTVGVVGADLETDAALRSRFNLAKAAASTASYLAIQAAISGVEDVISFILLENNQPTAQIISGVTVQQNSIYLIVNGGLNSDIAAALFNSKSGGCGMQGKTTYNYPIPNTNPVQYFIASYDVPTQENLTINVTLVKGGSYSPTVQSDIATAINENWSYTNLGMPIYALQFAQIMENAGITPVIAVTLTCSTFTDVAVLLLPINQTVTTPLLASNINIIYQ